MTEGETDIATEETATPTEESQTLIAKGSVVSLFRGGLAAVRIDEDSLDSLQKKDTTLSPTELKEQFLKDAGGDLVGHRVMFPSGQEGVVVAHRPPVAFVYNGMEHGSPNGTVSVLKEMMNVPVSEDAKVVEWDGTPINDTTRASKSGSTTDRAVLFAPIPQIKDIALINNPMLTGTTMVDVLAPIGQGQNMLVAADNLAATRGMICDFIATQTATKTKFVYAAIDNGKDVMDKLKAAGVLEDVHVVLPSERGSVDGEAKAAEATAMAASACAIAETYAVEQGLNAVVIVDTLDEHKKLWDATTRVLVDVFGVESVVKSDIEGGSSSEMRVFFSSIIQRAGQYKESRGGGSVTILFISELPKLQGGDEDTVYAKNEFEGGSEKVQARIQLLVDKGIPLAAANLRKIDIPIPSASEVQRRIVLHHVDDLISMTDGQIWLDETLRESGQFPPIDPQRSITRVGVGAETESRADAPALRRIAEGLRLDLSQAANMEGAEDTNASKKQIRRKNALLLGMHQEEGQGGRTLSESCTALLAASNGLLDDAVDIGKLAGTKAGEDLINGVLDHVQKVAPTAMSTIDQSLDLPESTQKEILDAIESYFAS